MPYYETVFIARQELSATQVKDLTDNLCNIITSGKGKVVKTEQWGLRTLAYRIRKNRKGHYVLIETDTAPEALIEMERQMRLSDDVLRYLSVKLEELSKGQSAILNRDTRDSDDRPDRSERYDRGDRSERSDRYKKDDKEAA